MSALMFMGEVRLFEPSKDLQVDLCMTFSDHKMTLYDLIFQAVSAMAAGILFWRWNKSGNEISPQRFSLQDGPTNCHIISGKKVKLSLKVLIMDLRIAKVSLPMKDH